MEQEKHIIIAQNRNIAEDNVTKEPEIVERKSRMSELSEQGKTICSSIQEKLNRISKQNRTNCFWHMTYFLTFFISFEKR